MPPFRRLFAIGDEAPAVMCHGRGASVPVGKWLDTIAPALNLHPRPPQDLKETSPLTIRTRVEVPTSIPHGEPVATDESSRLLHTNNEWHWICNSYVLSVESQAPRALLRGFGQLAPTKAPFEVARGVRHALVVLLPRKKYFAVHGALLQAPVSSNCLAIIGPSGSGKSTLAVGMWKQGWLCSTDDLFMFARRKNRFRLHGLTQGIRLHPDAWTRHLELEKLSDEAREPQDWEAFFGGSTKQLRVPPSPDVPVGAPQWMLFPSITDSRTSDLNPLSTSQALRKLLEQMQPPLALPPSAATDQLKTTAKLVRQAACFSLEAGKDLYDEPGRLLDLLPSPS